MGYVDWKFAAATGRRLATPGPVVSHEEAVEEVEAIREAAANARGPVAATSGLSTPDDAPAPLIVDRGTWIGVNAESMAALLDPAFDRIVGGATPHPAVAAVGAKVTGAEAGALLSFLSSKVLGQYDLAPGGTPRLMLVAPNLMEVADDLGVDRADFRSWVCMHEETHRVQFTANPWLRTYLIEESRALAVDIAPAPEQIGEAFTRITSRLPELAQSGSGGVAEIFTTPEQRAKMAELTAIMSLLEGHADVVMDDVGPAYIPSVAQIREKFAKRRKGAGTVDVLLRRLLGLEAKMRQYRDGAVFVRGVQELVGVEGFNRVWTSPDTLPRPAEIQDPGAWVARVHA